MSDLPSLPDTPSPGEVWTHKKSGVRYRVMCVARKEATLNPEVVYSVVGGGDPWTRPHAEFMDGRFVPFREE